jgi:lipid II:glycine glycyltransferase (peptidoglycan interpeptide bridge formation enzyme)
LKLSSKNWRHNLRRCHKNKNNVIKIWHAPDIDEIIKYYRYMEKDKQIEQQYSSCQIKFIIENFKDNCLVIKCEDRNGALLSLRAALILGNKGWDIFAVTSKIARKYYSSYGTFWELINQCGIRCVDWYDMSGVDAKNNQGVYNFKKGTGAKPLRYLGEWECSSPMSLMYLFRALIGGKMLLSKLLFSIKNKFRNSTS